MAARGNHSCERCAAERENEGSLHTVDLRHHPDQHVVNNSDYFCLPSTGAAAINESILTEGKTKSHPNFLLSVPADEDSLAHRRHVCSRMITQSLDSLTNRLVLEKIFGRKAPLHVDLGCGDGSFVCALAQRLAEKNLLGIERLLGRIRSSAHKAAGLSNVRLLQMESSYAVRYLLSAGSVETFYLLFPDPWPKRRHQRRRIVTPDFLRSIHTALKTGLQAFDIVQQISSALAVLPG